MRSHARGFTLVEVMIVVAIVGVLAALAIYGVQRHLASSRTAEAKQNVAAIARAATSNYESEAQAGAKAEQATEGTNSQVVTATLCGSAQPVPATVPTGKYQPITTEGDDFQTGTPDEGWKCLGFVITQPIYYQYEYIAEDGYDAHLEVPNGSGFQAIARGDLDDDGEYSYFARVGQVNPVSKALTLNTSVQVIAESE